MWHGFYILCTYGVLALSRALEPSQWQRDVLSDDLDVVAATIAFHQPKIQDAVDLLNDVSDPSSRNFGQYLDTSTIEDMFAPDQRSVQQVLYWLHEVGLHPKETRLYKSSGLLQFSATLKQMRELLDNQIQFPELHSIDKDGLAGVELPVPHRLQDHVESVTIKPTESKKTLRSRKVAHRDITPYKTPTAPNLKNCSLSWTPACIRDLYGIPLGTKAAPNNSIGIFGYGDYYNQADLDNFWKQYAQFIPKGTHPKVNFVNGAESYKQEIDGEELLDLQMAYPIVYPGKVEVFQMPYSQADGIANDFLDAVDASYCKYDGGDDPQNDPTYPAFQGFQGPAMCGTYKVSNVVSISFAKDESALPRHYVQRQCHEWMKLALQGVTVLVAAGDRGVMGNFACSVNPLNEKLSAFNPLFPSTCPFVTTVGATQVNFTGTQHKEVAVYDKPHNYWSGGGFSNFNSRPSYQDNAVKQYLAAHDPHYPAGTFNRSGRAFPDVALLGANVTISDGMEIVVSGGTSAATPLFAAMISRINDERILAGKKSIGFLNQILYQHSEVFNDITQGSNPGCDTAGFEAGKGWDPVSGLGSPSFPKLRSLLLSLP